MARGNGRIDELRRDYRINKSAIEERIAEFRRIPEQGDRIIFEELCYCILTAGSSAVMGARTVAVLRDLLQDGSEEELRERARASRVRFWRIRTSYIFETREYLRGLCGLRMRALLDSFETAQERRDFFARNKRIRGLGYKESSHFLRNIGYPGYAILDKHIINSLRELRIIPPGLRPTSRAGYLAIEKRLISFAGRIDIDADHLDLLLWSRKTGVILK